MMNDIETCVCTGDAARMKDILHQSTATLAARSVIEALYRGLERARASFSEARLSLPEFLLAIDAFRAGIALVNTSVRNKPDKQRCVLIGVVEGEVHDLGKNIVAAVLEASGFTVIAPKEELSRDRTLAAVKEHRPCIVALSAMMSTCIPGMQDTITWIRKLHPELKILVGGAALDADLAESIGAHGYAQSAITAPDEARRLMPSL